MLPPKIRADENNTSCQGRMSSILKTIINKTAVPIDAALNPYKKNMEKIKLKSTRSTPVK
ncbi:hypothetical protein D3C86_911710 [compost metagenome]